MYRKVYHHDHSALGTTKTAGRLICAAHAVCNLKATAPNVLPCIFHNSRRYDSKIIIQALYNAGVKTIDCIAKNPENVISLTIDKKVRIIDSFAHLPCSLSSLVEDLDIRDPKCFPNTKRIFQNNRNHFSLLVSKQSFPYEYITRENLNRRIKKFPPKSIFFSSLKNENISDQDFCNFKTIFRVWKCKKWSDVLKKYNLSDVCLLMDVWESYRHTILDAYNVDPTYFISSPSLSFAAGMGYSNAQLEYINDPDIYLQVRESLRGGMVFLNKRFALSNPKEQRDFIHSKPESQIVSFDVNSLYSFCLQQSLPFSNIRMLTNEELEAFDPLSVDDKDGLGYLIKCDLKIPHSVHDFLSDMPPCPEKIFIKAEESSIYQNTLVELYKDHIKNPFDKEFLLLNLYDKKGYSCYHKNLQYYCKLGVVIERIIQVICFTEKTVFKSYVDKNIALRNSSNSKAKKNVYKLILNSFYRSLAMRKELHKQIYICTNEARASQIVNKPYFESFTLIDENTSILVCKKTSVLLDRFPLVAAIILELSKLHMYRLWYDVFKLAFKDRIRLLYVDTDCLNMQIYGGNIDKDLYNLNLNGSNVFDHSNLPMTDPLYNITKKGIPGLLKNEVGGKKIKAFVGLKRKMYAFKFFDDKNAKLRAKGVPKQTLKRFSFLTYCTTLRKKKIVFASFRTIRSIKSQLYTILQRKIAFTALSTDRYIFNNGIDTLPYGHFRLFNETQVAVEESYS